MAGFGREGGAMRIDSDPFDKAVAGILKMWKPPLDIKTVIMHELGAVLALVSNETLCAGPKGAKIKNINKAKRYLKKRYTWGKRMERGKNKGKAKMSAEATPAIRIGGKVYFRGNYYPAHTWGMIQKELARHRLKSQKRAGSSKAAWMWMWEQAKAASGIRAKTPGTWKNTGEISKAMKDILKSSSWKKATTSKQVKKGESDFVLEVSSEAHNTLNPSVKGAASFQSRINGRQGYMERVMGKKMAASMEKITKKYPGLSTV